MDGLYLNEVNFGLQIQLSEKIFMLCARAAK